MIEQLRDWAEKHKPEGANVALRWGDREQYISVEFADLARIGASQSKAWLYKIGFWESKNFQALGRIIAFAESLDAERKRLEEEN